MKRAEFEHAIRAAAAVLGVREVLILRSQALHASVAGKPPPEASRSVEVDVAALHDDPQGRMADLVDGSIGEAARDACASTCAWSAPVTRWRSGPEASMRRTETLPCFPSGSPRPLRRPLQRALEPRNGPGRFNPPTS